VVNAADETWQIVSSYPEDPVLDPNEATETQVSGFHAQPHSESFT